MHDPSTLVYTIKLPWFGRDKWLNKRKTIDLVAIWHVDPCKGKGGDDSCGWFSPHLTDEEVAAARREAQFEIKYLFEELDEDGNKTYMAKQEPIAGIYTVFSILAWRVFRKQIKPKHVPEILSLSLNYLDSFRETWQRDVTARDIERTFIFIARSFKRMERPWYKHPRYHFWHYQFHIYPLTAFKRWAFSRCCKCKKGFKFGECVVANYESSGPKWFRGEKGIEHMRCGNHPVQMASMK